MRADRLLIGSVLFLSGGIWLLLRFCNGTTGLSFAWPLSGCKMTLDITTMGIPVVAGIPMIIVGLAMMALALIAAVVSQFRSIQIQRENDLTRRITPFEG